jgi:hemerythrin
MNRAEVNEVKAKNQLKGMMTQRWFFERINKTDKSLTKLVERKKAKAHINKSRD